MKERTEVPREEIVKSKVIGVVCREIVRLFIDSADGFRCAFYPHAELSPREECTGDTDRVLTLVTGQLLAIVYINPTVFVIAG